MRALRARPAREAPGAASGSVAHLAESGVFLAAQLASAIAGPAQPFLCLAQVLRRAFAQGIYRARLSWAGCLLAQRPS